MAHLIDKDAVLAIIEKELSYYKDLEDRGIISDCGIACYRVVRIIKSDIESLEVKEVDLEKEIECLLPKPAWGWNEDYLGKSDPAYSMEQMKEFAKHFFELGVKIAQKGE